MGARDSGGDAGGAGRSTQGSGKPGSDGPPGGTTDSGGDAGPGSNNRNKGTKPGNDTDTIGAAKPRGNRDEMKRQSKLLKSILSKDGTEKMDVVSGEVSLKGKPAPRKKVKRRQTKSVPTTGSKPFRGRPVKTVVSKPAETTDEPMETEVEKEAKQLLIQTSKQDLPQTK